MNKRIAKAKTTKKVEPKSATANTDASASAQKKETVKAVEASTQKIKKEAKEYTLYLQYQNREYKFVRNLFFLPGIRPGIIYFGNSIAEFIGN